MWPSIPDAPRIRIRFDGALGLTKLFDVFINPKFYQRKRPREIKLIDLTSHFYR